MYTKPYCKHHLPDRYPFDKGYLIRCIANIKQDLFYSAQSATMLLLSTATTILILKRDTEQHY